jgi:hypothetical protein
LIIRIDLLLEGVSPESIETRYTGEAVRVLSEMGLLKDNLSWFQSGTKPVGKGYPKLGVTCFF